MHGVWGLGSRVEGHGFRVAGLRVFGLPYWGIARF